MTFVPPPEGIKDAVRDGLSFVCATCRLYWDGRSRGLPGHQCTAEGLCGSPMRKDTFSQYDGPIQNMMNSCFVCGDRSKYALAVKGKEKIVRICENHVYLMKSSLGDIEFKDGKPDLSPRSLADLLREDAGE